jgi:hypothetical protein
MLHGTNDMRARSIVQSEPAQTAPRVGDGPGDASAESQTPSGKGSSGPWRLVRRIGIGIAGSVVLGVGLVLLVTPGPAFIVIPIGLGILSTEFEWARRWLKRVKQHVRKVMPHGERREHAGDESASHRA